MYKVGFCVRAWIQILNSDLVILVNDDGGIGTLSLSTASVAILLRSAGMRISGRLGSLALHDDSPFPAAIPEFKQIMSIEGDNFAEFTYATFEGDEKEAHGGINSKFSLTTASIKFHFVEHAIRSLYVFLIRLATLKGLYDAATQVAVQRASEIQRMQIEILVKSPIVVFPTDPASSSNTFTMRLGEISAKNYYEGMENKTIASLHGIRLASTLNEDAPLKIIDDIDIDTEVVQTSNIDRKENHNLPDTQVSTG